MPVSPQTLSIKLLIHCMEKDDDWYIYLYCFVHKTLKECTKTQKNCEFIKFDKSNAVVVGMTAVESHLSVSNYAQLV